MRRSFLGVLGVVVLAGCEALVGVKDLDVTGAVEEEVPDATAPTTAKDAGNEPIVDATAAADVDPSLPPPQRPPAKTYTYSLKGKDAIGQINWNAVYDGTKGTVVITHEGESSFTMAMHIRQNYDETLHFILQGTDFAEDKGTRSQKFSFGQGATTAQTCKPGDVYFPQVPSATKAWTHDCTGSNAANSGGESGDSAFRTVGPFTFVGVETKQVAGTNVETYHYHDDRVVTGAQTGSNKAEWWIAKSGVLVQLTRDISITYPSFVGNITYVEKLDMTLDALP